VDAERDTPGRWPAARATLALALAGARYGATVAPVVRGELARWRRHAGAIPDPELRRLALAKLERECFNAEAGAMLATRAPRIHRPAATRAIVALQLLFDLLDGLTEQPLADPLADGERLFASFTTALRPGWSRDQQPRDQGLRPDDAGYVDALAAAARDALALLPAWDAVLEVAAAAAERAAQAQVHMHAAGSLGTAQLERWARSQMRADGLEWRELLVGSASSVLAVHALIVAATEVRVDAARAARIDDAYLSICALLTLLDGLVDEREDERTQRIGYVGLYEDRELLARALVQLAARAAAQASRLPDAAHHLTILAGVVAYYTSSPQAAGARARPLVGRLHRALGPLVWAPLAFMRAWRTGKRLRALPASHVNPIDCEDYHA
jgi:tetraprenyl-beta-curcumene synthase